MAISRLDPTRPVVIEAESSKVGECRLPPGIWKAMVAAPRMAIAADVTARADYLVRAYGDMVADGARLVRVIEQLRPFHAAAQIEAWQAMAGAGAFVDLAAGLMQQHYDPRYDKHRARLMRGVEFGDGGIAADDLARLAGSGGAAVRTVI